jgi:hypothetical protein
MNAENLIQHIQYYNSLYYKYKYTFPIFAQRVLERKNILYQQYNDTL